MAHRPFKIVYNSDLIIRDRSEAATLCVFYDKVFLPFTSEATRSRLTGTRTTNDPRRDIQDWELEYSTLFNADVLERLPPVPHATEEWAILRKERLDAFRRGENDFLDLKNPKSVISQEQLLSILSMPVRTIRVGEAHFVAQDLAKHLVRTDIDLPQIFTTVLGQPVGRDVLAALEAEATFSYLLPKIRTFHATQILELREKVADTREGFTMHLWKLSKGLEEHTQGNTPVKEIARYAKNLIETDLIPDYREFQRQLTAIKAGKLEKVLDVAGKIFEIDAAVWTPKFWGLLLKAMGLSIVTAASEQEQLLSNKYQAFEFMSEIEGAR